MIGASVGGLLSNLCAGWLIDQIGPRAPAQVGGIAALVLFCLVLWMLPPIGHSPRPDPLSSPSVPGREPGRGPS